MLGPILSAVALTEAKRRVDRAVHNLSLSAAAGACLLVAVGFVVAAILVALTRVMDPIWACLIVAVAFLLVALGFWIAKRMDQPPRRRSAATAAMLGAVGGGAATAAVTEPGPAYSPRPATRRLMANKLILVLPAVAFVAAVAAGRWSQSGER